MIDDNQNISVTEDANDEIKPTKQTSGKASRRITFNQSVPASTPPKVESITVEMFKMWLEGVEEMQKSGWHPTATQWKTIRSKIDMLLDSSQNLTNQLAQVNQPAHIQMPRVATHDQQFDSGINLTSSLGSSEMMPRDRNIPQIDFTKDLGSDASSIQMDMTGGRSTNNMSQF